MRNNKILFDESTYNQIYNSENSFGSTYGEHRESLELDVHEFHQIRKCCSEYNVDLCVTPFDPPSVDACEKLGIDVYKVASFDLGNIPLLELIASKNLPVVISAGGGLIRHVEASLGCLNKINKDIALLHCVSLYPCPPEALKLNKISEYKKAFPDLTIGLSDHFNGILSGPLAYSVGARVFEKHVTFDRSSKGTDHAFSLEVDGFRRFARDINRAKEMLSQTYSESDGQEPVFKKLGKSVIAAQDIDCDTVITSMHVSGRIIRPSIVPVRDMQNVLGMRTTRKIHKGEYIDYSMLYE